MALAVLIGVAAVLVTATLYTAACARNARREARALREDIRRLHGALEVLALLVAQRSEAPSTATPVDVEPVEEDEDPSSDG